MRQVPVHNLDCRGTDTGASNSRSAVLRVCWLGQSGFGFAPASGERCQPGDLDESKPVPSKSPLRLRRGAARWSRATRWCSWRDVANVATSFRVWLLLCVLRPQSFGQLQGPRGRNHSIQAPEYSALCRSPKQDLLLWMLEEAHRQTLAFPSKGPALGLASKPATATQVERPSPPSPSAGSGSDSPTSIATRPPSGRVGTELRGEWGKQICKNCAKTAANFGDHWESLS